MGASPVVVASQDGDPVSQLVAQYDAQWQAILDRLAPPDPDSLVAEAALDPDSQQRLRSALESIDREYRQRLVTDIGSTTHRGDLDGTVIAPAEGNGKDRDPSVEARTQDGSGFDGPPPSSDIAAASGSPDPFQATATYIPNEDAESSSDPALAPTVHGDTAQSPPVTSGGHGKLPNVPGYDILGVLGRGGMGIVYRAWQRGLNRPVALKMILGQGLADAGTLARFRTEAEAVAQLDHENIVKVYETGTADGLPFFSLEFVDGGSLEEERDGKPVETRRAAETIEILARAMQRAHAAGLVHRDLKPANVLVRRDGVLKVTDFGLVKQVEGDSGQTQSGTIMGTPSYMAPEQAYGKPDVGPSADVYSLGAIFYALLTGRPPFLGPNPLETVMLVRHEEVVLPSRLQPKIPKDLETICLKCLQKDPAKRYGSAEELAEDLRRFRSGEPILARPVSTFERTWRWCRRKPLAATAILMACLLAVGGPTAALAINTQRQKAVDAQALAEKNEARAEKNETLAIENAALAVTQRDLAVTALNTIVERVPTGLKNVPGTERFKTSLLLTAMDGLNKVADTGRDTERDESIARAHAKMGEGLMEIGQAKSAREQFERSHRILQFLAESDHDTPAVTHHLRLGRSYRNLGLATARLDGARAAEPLFEQSLAARLKALPQADDPLFVKQEIAEVYGKLGEIALALGKPEEAVEHVRKAVDYRNEWLKSAGNNPQARNAQAGALLSLGHTSLDLGRPEEAAEHYNQAIAFLKTLTDGPQITGRANVAIAYNYLGTAHLLSGQIDEAVASYSEAVQRLDAVCKEAPRNAYLRRKLAQALYGLGVAGRDSGDPQAAAHLRRSCEIRGTLSLKAPSDVGFKQDWMISLARSGQAGPAAQLADELRAKLPEDAGNLYAVACGYALCAAAVESGPALAESPPSAHPRRQALRTAVHFRTLALVTLGQAVDHGYIGTALMQLDPDLAPIRQTPEFAGLLRGIEGPMTKDQ